MCAASGISVRHPRLNVCRFRHKRSPSTTTNPYLGFRRRKIQERAPPSNHPHVPVRCISYAVRPSKVGEEEHPLKKEQEVVKMHHITLRSGVTAAAMIRHGALSNAKAMEAFTALRTCMLAQLEKPNQLSEKTFQEFTKFTNYCVGNTDVSRVMLGSVKNSEETKYLIRNNTGSEFFGADPVFKAKAELFEQIGMFFPIAVSGRTGIANANIVQHGIARYAPVVNIDAETFFTKMINRTNIDLLIMDNEDGEYEIIPKLAIENVLEKAGMVVCQMNVEFHKPFDSEKWRYKHFVDILKGVLKTGRFAPIKNSGGGHQRMFLVNYADPYCVRKYLDQFFDPLLSPNAWGWEKGRRQANKKR
ncbi:hypothetical protein Q1695_016299 [Nippostrongylus brasiliensis]|nr:hypothetical protein Q1695_016299 [Nippostrongylus brasiliensis]